MDVTANRRAWHKRSTRDGWFGRAWDLGQLLRPRLLRPRLLRWRPAQTGPAHLRHSLDELRTAGPRQAVLVVAPGELGEHGLERLSDARRQGATLLAVTAGSSDLEGLSHEAVTVPRANRDDPLTDDFGLATHVLTVSAGTVSRRRRR
jgi:hypothetical protein